MVKRVAMMLWVVISMSAWAAATGSLSAAGAPKAYVGLFKDDAVAVLDTAQNKVVGTIAVPKGPHGLVVTPDGRKVYVCLLYTSPSPRDRQKSRMPSSA